MFHTDHRNSGTAGRPLPALLAVMALTILLSPVRLAAADLPQVLRDTLRNAPRLKEAETLVSRHRAGERADRGGLFPLLTIEGSAGRSDGNPSPATSGREHLLRTRVQQPLYDPAGVRQWQVKTGQRILAEEELHRTRTDLILTTSVTWLEYLKLRTQLARTGESIAESKRMIEMVRKRIRLGDSTRLELMDRQILLQERQRQLATIRLRTDQLYTSLTRNAGVRYPFHSLPRIGRIPDHPPGDGGDRETGENPLVRIARQNVVVAGAQAELAAAEFHPELSLFGQHEHLRSGQQSQNRTSLGLSVTFRFDTGGSGIYRYRSQVLERRRRLFRLEREKKRAGINLAGLRSELAMHQQKAAFRRTEVKLLLSSLESRQQVFAAGYLNTIELLRTQTKLFDAKMELTSSRFDQVITLIRIFHAQGNVAF